jgi:hypothetical protein
MLADCSVVKRECCSEELKSEMILGNLSSSHVVHFWGVGSSADGQSRDFTDAAHFWNINLITYFL